MKYIRTKDRIVELKKMTINDKLTDDYIHEKVADTIEELCDEFILVNEYRFRKPKTATELEKDFDEMKSFYTNKNDKIYGAIWTYDSNGVPTLKPVAKINEKGELELI